ncbi:hypothetical protein AMTR_s00137p00065090 [Amborella trichopoda]|uniref:Pentacotripeptide-repeat region of PRORP domain-containing protein n=1 Tax=Amborella trichopoda TaxID=13333 RepID=W1NDU9_AMBTC|nr:hypothetical protein AMTR_s00137p00065090 [Amborella trichopoda]
MLQREHPFFCRKASVCYNLLRGFPPSSTVEQIHAQVVIHGLSDNAFLATHLLKSYAKAGRVCDARLLFNSHSKPDIFLCNAIIRAHTHFELWPQALQLYLQMRRKGVLPDHFTLPFVLKSCAALSAINNGKKLQRTDWKFELADIIEEDKLQQSNLRLGLSATKEGQKIHQWSVISDGEKLKQTPLQLGLSDISEGEKLHKTALQLRLSAISDGEKPSQSNPQTGLCATREGKKLHKTALELGLESNVYIATALLDFYAKSGDMDAAYKVFDEMPQKDVVTWSAMIAGYSELGDSNKALRMFQKMRSAPDCEYNEVTILGLIPAFKGSVKLCKWVHGLVLKSGLGSFHLVKMAMLLKL